MTDRKDKNVSNSNSANSNREPVNQPRSTGDQDLSAGLGNLEDDDFLIEEAPEAEAPAGEPGDAAGTTPAGASSVRARRKARTDDEDPLDPQDPGADGADITTDDDEIEVVTVDDEVPYELRDAQSDPAAEPRTGLVSEFRDLTGRQAAWLVSNRETTSTSRSPLFYITALVIGLAVLAALVIGLTNATADTGATDTTVAVVGIGEQAPLFEQQLGMQVENADTVEAAQEMVRNGTADAALIPDPTGQGNDTIVALNSEPTAVLDRFAPQLPVTYLEPPAVNADVSQALGWGMAFLLIASVMTLGAALYSNLRVEKRNRIAEIIAATVPAKSAAWGRVYGLSLLSLAYLVIAVGILLLGLSIAARTSLAVAMMPGLGWFAGLFLLAHLMYLSLYLWAGTGANRRSRQVGYGITVVLLLAGAIAPLFFFNRQDVLQWMSWIPFTAPVATPLRYFASQAEWWEGLISLAVVLVLGLILFALAAASYRRNLLRGSGRAGTTARVKGDKKANAEAGDAEDAEAKDAEAKDAEAKDAGAEDDDPAEVKAGRANADADLAVDQAGKANAAAGKADSDVAADRDTTAGASGAGRKRGSSAAGQGRKKPNAR